MRGSCYGSIRGMSIDEGGAIEHQVGYSRDETVIYFAQVCSYFYHVTKNGVRQGQ